jgi:hypothetical protein
MKRGGNSRLETNLHKSSGSVLHTNKIPRNKNHAGRPLSVLKNDINVFVPKHSSGIFK